MRISAFPGSGESGQGVTATFLHRRAQARESEIGLYFGWYNYCRVHSTIKTTPAVAQGLADKPWSIEELLMAAA